MPTTRHLIVCEGQSEWAYLQRLQSFLDDQPVPPGSFETPLRFIGPKNAIAKTGSFGKLKSAFNRTRTGNPQVRSIQVWADFDLYHRNDCSCAANYAAKTPGIPDFLFSFHNFEDFYALHFAGDALSEWVKFGGAAGLRHFTAPPTPKATSPRSNASSPATPKAGSPPPLSPGPR
jgi:hypothetical protein